MHPRAIELVEVDALARCRIVDMNRHTGIILVLDANKCPEGLSRSSSSRVDDWLRLNDRAQDAAAIGCSAGNSEDPA
jgi:hypothetical protein